MGLVRNWLIRAVILAALVGVAAAGRMMHDWVSPDAVRAALVAALQEQFPDTDVHVGSARLRLFGGLCVTDLRLTRKGEPEPFFAAPAAVVAHDKEQLHNGRLVIRKIELDGPTVRLARRPDGSWGLPTLPRPGSPEQPVPTVTARNVVLILTDGRPGGLPPVAVAAPRISLINDPVHTLKLDAQLVVGPAVNGQPATGDGVLTVPVMVAGKLHRPSGAAQVHLEVADLAVTPDLAPVAAKADPRLADLFAQLTAHVGVKADLSFGGEAGRGIKYDVRVEVREGRWDGPDLPWPAEHIAAVVRIADGRVSVEKGTAKVGKAACDFSLESRTTVDRLVSPTVPGPRVFAPPRPLPILQASHAVPAPAGDPDPLRELEEKLDRFELTVRDLALDDDLFGRLPPLAGKLRRMFSPTGAVDLDVKFARTSDGWTREVVARPNRLGVVYEKFRYPVSDVAGTVKRVTAADGTDEFQVQLTGTAGGRRVEATGQVGAVGADPLVELKIAGTDVPIDDRLFAALPPKYAAVLGQLRATGRGDFVAELRQAPGVNRLENAVRIRVYGGAGNPTPFPLPLTDLSGRVRVWVTATAADRPLRPGLPIEPLPDTDRVELDGFEAAHAGGKVWVPSGQVVPVPGGRKVGLNLQGLNVPLDADLRAAMTAVRLDKTLAAFRPQGAITFGADLEVLDWDGPAGGFDPVSDFALVLNFKGPTITPVFFPYELADLAGVLRYKGGQVNLAKLEARHGASRVELNAAEVRFMPGGGVWANVGGLEVKPFVPDAALISALPSGLRAGAAKLNAHGPMELAVKQMVVQTGGEPVSGDVTGVPAAGRRPVRYATVIRAQSPADPGPVLFWNAELRFAGAALEVGLDWNEVHGAVACVGRYDGDRLGTVVGNAWIDRAVLSDHPVSAVKAGFRVRPQEPDPTRPGCFTPPAIEFPDLTGTVYEGTVGGEARLVLGDTPQFRLWLTAAGVRLDALARELKLGSGAELRGLAQGRLLLENPPDPKTGLATLTGAGQVDVPTGRMYKLGVLLPMLKLLKLQAPDETAFEEAHAAFELVGDKVKVTSLDLVGTAISLGGSGELDTHGQDARFEFYTVWSQALRRWLNTPFGDVASFLSGNLFKIEVVRHDGRTAYTPHMLPAVTDPVRAVAERFRNRVLTPEPAVRAATPR